MMCIRRMVLFAAILALPAGGRPQRADTLILAAPGLDGGNPLFPVLMKGRTGGLFSPVEIPLQILSELLWSACGINDLSSGRRTAPSAYDAREIDVYVATAGGFFLYDAQRHRLLPLPDGDMRAETGMRDFVGKAPVHLLYVADLEKLHSAKSCLSLEKAEFLAAVDAGIVSQNASLYCASAGLSTVVRDMSDCDRLRRKMKVLKPMQRVILVQAVGFAGK